MVFELFVINKKKKEEEERKRTKLKFSTLLFSASEWDSRTLGTVLTVI